MKTKYTKQNEEDFYYLILLVLMEGNWEYINQTADESFIQDPNRPTEYLNKHKIRFPRETSPETYEYYVADYAIELMKIEGAPQYTGMSVIKTDYYKHKIKITICEDE